MRRDVASAYVVTLARLVSWIVVLALVYRKMGSGAFATLALVRATVGLFNYASLGIAPAMVHLLAKERAEAVLPVTESARGGSTTGESAMRQASSDVLSYASPDANRPPVPIVSPLQSLYFSGWMMMALAVLAGSAMLVLYVGLFAEGLLKTASGLRDEIFRVIWLMGVGVLLRVLSDASGAVLQAAGRITLDNLLLAGGEVVWLVLCILWITDDPDHLPRVAAAFALASGLLLVARFIAAETVAPIINVNIKLDWPGGRKLLAFGLLVTLTQAADYLYAPTDYLLIHQLLGPDVVSVYVPAVQIDAGLLLLVTGLSSVIFPRAAVAYTAGRLDVVRRYYILGTMASAALLTAAGAIVWVLSPWIFKTWLGNPMRPTQLILPLVLIHTIVGGSSAVGRSILLGMGKVRPFTIAVLVAGAANVLLSYIFVKHLGLGLNGIIYGTVLAVTLRAGVWMPWYVMRVLRRGSRI
ncbi:MAG: lipopolysaccharide biosynthesis protein [Tepidisphaeraceae bacterium]